MSSVRPTRLTWLLALPVVVYFLLVWPAVHGPFVFDDFPNLAALAKVGPIDSLRDLGIYLSESRFFPGRPLAMLSFLPQQADWPGNPQPFKIANLALHALNALLLFALLRRLVPARAGERATWIAGLAAVVWLVMPMQLSAVMLVVQRMTLLATLFTLLGLHAYVHGLRSERGSLARAAWMGAGIGGGTLLAVLCKENGVLLPLLAWVIDATLLREHVDALPPRLRAWRRVLLFPAIAVIVAYLLWQLRHLHDPLPTRDFTLYERLLTQPRVLLDYLEKSLLPSYSRYGVFHDDFVVSRGLLTPWTTLPALLAVVAAAGIAFASLRRAPLLAFGILWFLGGHLIEAGPLSLEIYFEHRNYLPIAGPVFALVAAIAMLRAGTARSALATLGAIWLLAALLACALSAQVWSSEVKLAFFWAAEHPESPRAQTYYAQNLHESGVPEMARGVMAGLAASRPEDVGPATTLLFLDCVTGAAKPGQVTELRERLRTAPWTRSTYQGLGELRALAESRTCKILDDKAWFALSDALLANPQYASSAGILHYQRHELAVARRDLDVAIAELDEVARHDPDPEIVRLQARYLVEAGLHEAAIERLAGYDPAHRPTLRRWLVDDVAINREAIETIRKQRAAGK